MKTHCTWCQYQKPRLALSTHWGHERNGRTGMQMGGQYWDDWTMTNSMLASEINYSSTVYSWTSPIKRPSVIQAGEPNAFPWSTYGCWEVDHRLVVENTGKFACIVREIVSCQISLCLGELECKREHVRNIISERAGQWERVREIMSERSCPRDGVRAMLSERICSREYVGEIMSQRVCQRDHVTESVPERSCQRDHVREIISERLYQRDYVREFVSERLC